MIVKTSLFIKLIHNTFKPSLKNFRWVNISLIGYDWVPYTKYPSRGPLKKTFWDDVTKNTTVVTLELVKWL